MSRIEGDEYKSWERNERTLHKKIDSSQSRAFPTLNKGDGKFLMYKLLHSEKSTEEMRQYFGVEQGLKVQHSIEKNLALAELQIERLEKYLKHHSKNKISSSEEIAKPQKKKRRKRIGEKREDYSTEKNKKIAQYFDDVYKGIIYAHFASWIANDDESESGDFRGIDIDSTQAVVDKQNIHVLSPGDMRHYGFDAIIHDENDVDEPTMLLQFSSNEDREIKIDQDLEKSFNLDKYIILRVGLEKNQFQQMKHQIKNNFNDSSYMHYNAQSELDIEDGNLNLLVDQDELNRIARLRDIEIKPLKLKIA